LGSASDEGNQLTIIVIAVVLEFHRRPDPVVPNRLVRMDGDRVALASENFESANDLRDVADPVDLHGFQYVSSI
jgi:hypothetical protein